MKKRIRRKILAMLGITPILGFLIVILPVVIMVTAVAGGSGYSEENSNSYMDDITNANTDAQGIYEANVERYRQEVERACAQFDNEPMKKQCGSLIKYVNLALAIMTEESHGASIDPMQSSLCGFNTKYPHNPAEGKGITDPSYSIDCGVQYMRNALITAKVESPTDFGKIGVAVQGYNYGVEAWCKWIAKNGGNYTVPLAEKYRTLFMGGKGTPTHGEKVLTTYRNALKIAETTSGVTVNVGSVADIIKLSEKQSWQMLVGSSYTAKPNVSKFEELKAVMPSKMTTITVKVWWWKGSKGYEKETKTATVTIHKNMKAYWQSFFNDVYNDPSQIIINPSTLYGYSYRMNQPRNTAISAHSFGVAVDINPELQGNGYGQTPYTTATLKKLKDSRVKRSTTYVGCPLVTIAQKYSLSWGGAWSGSKDGMHFSFCGDTVR